MTAEQSLPASAERRLPGSRVSMSFALPCTGEAEATLV